MKRPGFFQRLFANKKPQKRGFFTAQPNRLTADWPISVGQIDADLRGDLVAIRGQARELCKSNDYAKKYLRLLKQNIVGSEGFSLQVNLMTSIRIKTAKNAVWMKLLTE
ncbi:MAG: phage portal protein [Ignavibacteriales bacterium]|nr:phage portal protein [Ignavibacteriales bacterium]